MTEIQKGANNLFRGFVVKGLVWVIEAFGFLIYLRRSP
jgi:hypothetical protein